MLDLQGPVTLPEPGQVAATPDSGTTAVPPDVATGQAPTEPSSIQGQAASAAPEETTFFDPSALAPELVPAYKSMQAAFTKKMQAISGDSQKIQAFDQYMADPVGNLQQMAKQHGYSLSRGDAQQMINQQQSEWAPQTWDDVMARAKQEVMQEVMQQFSPMMQTVQKVQASNIETQLAQIDPEWIRYEDKMRTNLSKHPTLVNDVESLYRMSVPKEVFMSQATQAAIKKMQDKAQAASVADKSTTSRSAPAPKKASSFDEAVAIAKEQLANQGR